MKKINFLLVILLSVFVINNVNAETITNQIIGARNDNANFKNITQSDFTIVEGNKGLTKDEDGKLIYKFALGCELGKACTYSVTYSGAIETFTSGSTTIDIATAKAAWNAGKTVTENDSAIEIQSKNKWNNNGMNNGTASFAAGAVNNYTAVYSNVGKYGDENVDVKATIVALEEINPDSIYRLSEPAVLFRNDQIGVSATGIKWVTVKFEFLKSGTSEPIEIMGNTSYWDIDQNQGVLINKNDGENNETTNKNIYYTATGLKCTKANPCTPKSRINQLKYATLDSGIYIFDQNSGLEGVQRIYKDNLQSTSYAFTEEFKGTSITRTFQFSDPVLKSSREGNNTWNGHGAIYLSSTAVSEKYLLTTEVVHGTIVPEAGTVTEYEYGDVAVVTYQPEKEYELSYIEIDGTKVELSDKIEKDKLQIEMKSNHHIKVVYTIKSAQTGLFEISGVLFIIIAAFVAYKIVIRKRVINEV